MSSSLRYTFTKLRSLPCSLYRCGFSPLYLVLRLTSSSPIVAPSTSTASCLPVNGRNGVGIRILFAITTYAFFVAEPQCPAPLRVVLGRGGPSPAPDAPLAGPQLP